MTIQDLKTTITALNEEDFSELFDWVCGDERDRRKAAPAVAQAQADLVTELQDAGKLEKPEAVTEDEAKENADSVPEWENPLTDHSKMYALDAVVAHNGRFWKSTPPEENTASPGAIPFAPGLPVKEGDLIEHDGVTYRVLSAHTTQTYWPPAESPSLFQRV